MASEVVGAGNGDTDKMDVDVDVEDIDEFQQQFDQLEASKRDQSDKLSDFLLLLRKPRTDDQATKIKELCIYR